MAIRTIEAAEHPGFVTFLNAGMRPDGGPTRADEDFPVILAADNLEGLWGLQDARGWAAGLAVLVRSFRSSAGDVAVAGIGSVVTREDRRGEGLSRRIQAHVLANLAARGVPLAVLWTDQPAIYAGRGFKPAGWEYHLDLTGADLAAILPEAATIRPFCSADTAAVGELYAGHPLHTLRRPADHGLLYGMPGSRGLVLEQAGQVVAYAFAGKGADFPDYVPEWGGEAGSALALLAAVRNDGLAHRVLVPAGREDLIEAALARGGDLAVVPSGLWSVLRPELLPTGDQEQPADLTDPAAWLGTVGDDGLPVPGVLALAVWGFDSV